MASGSLSRRYARALIALAREADIVDRVGDDLARFDAVLDLGQGVLRVTLENPGLTAAERRGILDRVLVRLDVHKHVGNFLRLLIDKQRFGYFSAMLNDYRLMADELAGRVRAVVTTARPADQTLSQDILSALQSATGKQVLISFQVDPAIIGGVIARVGDTVYDASVIGRLGEIRQALGSSSVAEA